MRGTLSEGKGRQLYVDKVKWIFAALCLVWGSTWIASDALSGLIPLLCASSLRFLLSSAFCLLLLPWRNFRRPSARAFLSFLLLSVTMMVLPLLLLRWARPQLPSATVVVLYAAAPLCVILLTPVFGGREAPPTALYASIVGLGGILLATGAAFSPAQTLAAAIVLVAVIATAVSTLLAQRLAQQHHPVMLAAWVLGLAGLLLALASRLLERSQPVVWNHSVLAWLLLLATAGGGPAYAAWFWLLGKLPAYQVATIEWMEPLVALGESALFLRIGFSVEMFAGAAITMVSLLWMFRCRREDDQSVSLLGF